MQARCMLHLDDPSLFDLFLTKLNSTIAEPTRSWPTVRCWEKRSLERLFAQILSDPLGVSLRGKVTHDRLVEHLCSIGLAHQIETQTPSSSRRPPARFYLLEIGSSQASVSPLELLQAYSPAGVICYFTAVTFHSLTTQTASHHHVADLQPPARVASVPPIERIPSAPQRTAPVSRNPLGTACFIHQNIPYYSTKRSQRSLAGFQTRDLGPRTRFRITTLEQTLLDTLTKPFHCGGPSVIFEAWEAGLPRVGEDRLVEYLTHMNYPATTRRLGAMLDLFDYTPQQELRQVLSSCQSTIDRDADHSRISLLPGLPYSNFNDKWQMHLP